MKIPISPSIRENLPRESAAGVNVDNNIKNLSARRQKCVVRMLKAVLLFNLSESGCGQMLSSQVSFPPL